MSVVHRAHGPAVVDVLDRVLDKGVVVDAHLQFDMPSIHLVDGQTHVVVASVETLLEHEDRGGRPWRPGPAGRWESRLRPDAREGCENLDDDGGFDDDR